MTRPLRPDVYGQGGEVLRRDGKEKARIPRPPGGIAAILILVLLLLAAPASFAGEPAPAAGAEIAYLFARLEACGCDFYRNGSRYGSREAVAHLRRKYRYLLEKGLVSSAEEFIERAASKSSSSGRPYQVRCGGGNLTESGPWLRAELMKYRRSRK